MDEVTGLDSVRDAGSARARSAANGRWRRRAVFGLKLLLAAAILVWLFRSGRLDFSQLRQVRHTGYLILAGLMLFLSMLLPAWRWYWLTRVQRLDLSLPTAVRLTWVGYFATLFLPGAAGGDLAKAYMACRHRPTAKTRAVSTVLVDRLLGLYSLLFIGSVAGGAVLARGCDARVAILAAFPLVLLVAFSAGLFVIFWQPSSGLMLKVLPGRFRAALEDSLGLYRSSWPGMVAIWSYSAVSNVAAIAAFGLAGTALDVGLRARHFFTVIPLVIVANSLPITPGGLGVGETVGSQLFTVLGLTQGALIVLSVRLGVIALSLPGILVLFDGSVLAKEVDSRG